jgi:hypothetical protein
MKYHQYLKGNQLANGLRKKKLQLRVVQSLDQCFGDLKVLNNAMAKMLETTIFGSQKRKPDKPLGDEQESH